ncbi:MAG: pinensin family lanthipeptide [Cyclobacteriaceae bacterium]
MMKKLTLKDLKVNSFTTTEQRVIVGGAEICKTEHKEACPETEAMRDTNCQNNEPVVA